MEHSFDIDIATKYGIEEAILFKNIVFWVKKNQANKQNYFDNQYWTYNSIKAFQKLFPYMTERQIRYSLDKLVKEELIIKGEYNQLKYDRTSWYAIGKAGQKLLDDELSNEDDKNVNTNLQNCQIEMTKLSNGDAKIVEPIPYINTYINTNKDDDEINKPTADFQDKVLETLQKYGGMNINTYITDTLDKSDIPEDLKVEAIERWIGASDTSSQKLPSANYLKKILVNIKKSGATTVEELEVYENENKKSNSDRWYELQKEQNKLKQRELDLKEQNQPYYQQQIKMQYDKENNSQYLAQTLAYEEEKQRLQKLSGDVPKQLERTLPTKEELQLMSEEERKKAFETLSLEEIKEIMGENKG